MLHAFLQPAMIMTLFVLVRAGDLAIASAMVRDTIRAVLYGLVALLALVVVLLVLLGLS